MDILGDDNTSLLREWVDEVLTFIWKKRILPFGNDRDSREGGSLWKG